jgi:2-polyprenyl-3-methyl-5-hydroxy-6-metoxy-1,4-benzoquinol methylase
LCCGNGQITKEIAKNCKEIYAVDFEKTFIDQIKNLKIKNIKTFCKDIKTIQFKKKFDKILFYAGIQYFEKKDIIYIFKKNKKIYSKNCIIFVGDIPDQQKIWNFYSNDKYLKFYIRNLLQGKSTIGNWLDKNWLIRILQHLGFKKVTCRDQNKNLLNYKSRFDIIIN